MECNTKSNLPPKISIALVTKFWRSSILVASAGMISEPVFSAKFFICPIRIATGALVSTNLPPSSCTRSAVFQAIEFSSKAPKMMPFFPFNKLYIILSFYKVKFVSMGANVQNISV